MIGELTTRFVAETLAAQGCTVQEGPSLPINGGAADSRKVTPGDLFAAFRGEHSDGNDFVPAAIAAGARAVVCERAPAVIPAGVTVAVVPDTRAAMAALGRAWRRACNPTVVGITGTVGKTTAKEMVAATLAARFRTHRSPGNLNSREGLPLALMSLTREHAVSVLEMAMDSKGEIADLCAIAEPNIGVVLNIGLTHVEKLGSIEAIAAEKLSLVEWLPSDGVAILNADDPRVDAASGRLAARVVRFGRPDTGADLSYADIVDRGLDGLSVAVRTAGSACTVHAPLPGVHTLPAVLAAIACAMALGMSLAEAAAAVEAANVNGRLRRVRGRNGATLLDDTYNSSPASLAGALRTLDSVANAQGHRRRIALIGKMAELGDHEEEEHRAIGRVAAATCDLLFAVGAPCRALVDEARAAGLAEAHWFEAKSDALTAVRATIRSGDLVLLKASRSQAFETLVAELSEAPE